MTKLFSRALALSTALGAAGLLGAVAIAQTPAPSAPPAQPSQASPDTGPRGPGMGRGEGMGRDGMGDGRMGRGAEERGGGRMGPGYNYGPRGGDEARRGPGRGEGWGDGRGRMGQLSDTDRQAMLSARLAAAKAALLLTPEQEKQWGPLEAAIRDSVKLRQDWRARIEKDGPAANPVDRMKRMGEMASARGAAMTKLADAAGPLYTSLTDDQKRRLRLVGGMGGGLGMGMGGGMGPGMGPGARGGERFHGEGMRGGRGADHRHDHHYRYDGGRGRGDTRM